MINEIIGKYSFEDVLTIEESDRQFLALKGAWDHIKNRNFGQVDRSVVQEAFLKAIVFNSMITYQIAGSGELRWEEFANKLKSDFDILLVDFIQGKHALERWYNLMMTSKYNKRLYNIKLSRLKKLSKFKLKSMAFYYENMLDLRTDLSEAMSVDKHSKTISFAVKMFGYTARVVYQKFIPYPLEISIPVDSRIRKLFVDNYGDISDNEIIAKVFELSQKSGIAPLHLDSLFWVRV